MPIFNDENIKIIEDNYDASYINDFDLERGSLDFTITGAVFYVENPDVSKGHSNYFAMYRDPLSKAVYITNAVHLTEREYPAIKFGEDDYLVSRGRHDYVSRDGAFLDGGAAYTRCNPNFPPTHKMRLIDGKEVFEKI